MKRPPSFRLVLVVVLAVSGISSGARAGDGLVEITVRELGSGKLLPCRIHVIERGLEYRRIAAAFEVQATGEEKLDYEMERLAELGAEGWWSGEMRVHRPLDAVELLMIAEDLHVAP